MDAVAISLLQGNAVQAQLGGTRHGKIALGTLTARGRLAPCQGLRIFLAATQMRQHQARWWRSRHTKALTRLAAQDVLHGQGLTHAQQIAVHDGVGTLVGLGLAAAGQVEAPGLDATVPIAPGKRQVFHHALAVARWLRRAGADKVRLAVAVVGLAYRRLRRDALEAGDARSIGLSITDFTAPAIRHTDHGTRYRRAFVERGDPGQGVLTSQLEMHGQIGHQRGGADVHGAPGSVARVQQRSAQLLGCNLHHMEAGIQWNTYHLKRARIVARRLGQVQRFHARLALQQRDHAGLYLGAVRFIERFGKG